jgi:YVTN family beta-propeller protein
MALLPPTPFPAAAVRLVIALILLLAGGAGAASSARADFDFEVYSGTWDFLPDFTALTPVATGTSTAIGVGVTGLTDHFGLVFTQTIQVPTSGQYEWRTNSDDGSKLYIDGALVVDNDGLHAPRAVASSTQLTAGSHSLRVEFFEKGGGQVIEVGYRTGGSSFDPVPADGELIWIGSEPSIYGEWGGVIQWPEIAISAASLPDGRVLTWSSTETNAFPSGSDFTHASVFDPVTETFVSVDSNFHDMFCAGISTLENGTIVASGGNPYDRKTSMFDPATLTWSPLAEMIDQRWYASNVTLPNNKIFSTFGKQAGDRSELYDPLTDSWTATPNATMATLVSEQNAINAAPNPTGAFTQEWWAHIAVAPQGDVFQGGPTQTWHRFDPIGGAPNVVLGQPIGDTPRMYGNAVTYDEGKVILVGGGDRRSTTPTSVDNVFLVDLNGPAPVVTQGASMNFPRALSNTVVLPNGEVLVIGGNTVAKIFSDEGSVLPAEIYTPSSDSWRVLDSITIPRNYHSTALLLKDGRVLSAGGGACGNCSANHLDGQIFSPPYLFESDDSPAVRPTYSLTGPGQVRAGQELVVNAGSDVTSWSIVRLSGTTHHLNTDQRFLPLASVDNGDGTHTLTFPANPNVLIVGYYWLFALDADGTPSIAEPIQVIRDPYAGAGDRVYLSDLTWESETNGYGPAERDTSNGEDAAGDGNPITLDGVVYEKGVGVHAFSEIVVRLDGAYTRFRADVGLDDERDGLCGEVSFQVDVDGVVGFTSGPMDDVSPTQSIDLDVSGGTLLTLSVFDEGATCGDHADWADAHLIAADLPGNRYYRFTPTKLRDDAAASSVQLAELSFFVAGLRQTAAVVTNPGGNNPAGEGPTLADDANTATKWLDFNKGALVYDFGTSLEIDAYGFTTANDAIERDPVRWLLEGSDDATRWVVLDDRTGADFPTPMARQTEITTIDLVVLSPITPLPDRPRHSTTLLVEPTPGGDRIWNVNPDNDTVAVSDEAGALLAEIAVGDQPWSIAARPGADEIFVTNKKDASLSVIDASTLGVLRTTPLTRGSMPHGLVFDSTGTHYFVVLEALARVEKRLAIDDTLVDSLVLSGAPRHVSMTWDDTRLLVSNFITPPIPGESTLTVDVANGAAEVFAVDPASMGLVTTHTLPHDGRSPSESQGPGMPNYLGPPVVSFAGTEAYVPTKKDNVQAGALRMVPGMTFESTVRANVSRIDLGSGLEDPLFRFDLDNSSVATGVALTGDDRYVLTTLETSRELSVYDTQGGFELMRLPTGRAPQSVALSSDGAIAYVHDFMDRRISRFDLTEMLETNLPATNVLAPIFVVGSEALAPNVLNGKQLFYDAEDDRLSLDNYMSCAACHNDGRHDGRVWDLGFLGEGVRRTIGLRGRGTGHGLLHWSGNFDEVQDFENQIRLLGLGQGLMADVDFLATQATLGAPKAGLSSDLDDLAAYVGSLTEVFPSPHRPTPTTLSASAIQGRQELVDHGCLGCHAPPALTDSASALRHDVGTIDAASGQRLGAPLDGFDTPSLLGAWTSPPYLHDGSAPTLEAAILAHSSAAALSSAQVTDLAQFLREAESADLDDLVDGDGDGVIDLNDPTPGDPCVPSAFVAVCALDSDGDGVADFAEGELVDSDGDGLPDWEESSVADADLDGVVDQDDPANGDACVPDPGLCAAPVPVANSPLSTLLLLLGLVVTALLAAKRLVAPDA